jgi:hypothetical protein
METSCGTRSGTTSWWRRRRVRRPSCCSPALATAPPTTWRPLTTRRPASLQRCRLAGVQHYPCNGTLVFLSRAPLASLVIAPAAQHPKPTHFRPGTPSPLPTAPRLPRLRAAADPPRLVQGRPLALHPRLLDQPPHADHPPRLLLVRKEAAAARPLWQLTPHSPRQRPSRRASLVLPRAAWDGAASVCRQL